MKVYCRTNLDVEGEQWPDELPVIPCVGNLIQSATKWGQTQVQIELKVCGITWKKHTNEFNPRIPSIWVAHVEMTLPDSFRCISHFSAWYDYIKNRIQQETYQQRVAKYI